MMIILRTILFLGWIAAPVMAMESFEAMPAGIVDGQASAYGKLSAGPGHASVIPGKGRSGKQALHLAGGSDRWVTLDFDGPIREKRSLAFWAERWTRRGDCELRVEVKAGGQWSESKRENGVKVGGYDTHLVVELPVGASALRFSCTSEGGVLIDDMSFTRMGPMSVLAVTTTHEVVPVMRRKQTNPVLGFTVMTEGNEKPISLEAVEISLVGTTHPEDIECVDLVCEKSDASGKFGEALATAKKISSSLVLTPKQALLSGANSFWISVKLKDSADIDGRIAITLNRVKVGGKVIVPVDNAVAGVSQRIGVALRLQGDDGSHSYRIPGLVRTRKGTLIAVYDIRYNGCGDLPAKIDVGASRSSDGGQVWEDMRIAMHCGTMGGKFEADGVGDPAILVDEKTGRIWLAALWSHGNHAWANSGPGMTPGETGQLLLAYSDDDGKTWSELRNITAQIKDPAWRLVFNGPGAGICMKDGTLVFPAQFRSANGGRTNGKPFSTILYSKDRGETWVIGSGARIDTTEAQVVELKDGLLMLNCRDNRGGSRTVMVTDDMGKTWTPHVTDRGALPEPVCMASLLRWDHPQHGDLFIFSNPAATDERHNMSLRFSKDNAVCWPEKWRILYDSRRGSGYSCLASADMDHIGILYEGNCEIYYMRLPLGECLK